MNSTMQARVAKKANAVPTPIPAFAPVDKPLDALPVSVSAVLVGCDPLDCAGVAGCVADDCVADDELVTKSTQFESGADLGVKLSRSLEAHWTSIGQFPAMGL